MAENFLFSFMGMFVAMDIIGILPMYLGMTSGMEKNKKRRVVNMSILVAAVVALVFGLIGSSIFRFIGIAMYDFKVGGGIVLLIMAILDLIHHSGERAKRSSTGVVPLGVPLITGPGLITTVMLQIGIYGSLIVTMALAANFLFAWVALRQSSMITKLIGEEGTDIVSKIAALLMTAIAFSMIRSGVFEAIRAASITMAGA